MQGNIYNYMQGRSYKIYNKYTNRLSVHRLGKYISRLCPLLASLWRHECTRILVVGKYPSPLWSLFSFWWGKPQQHHTPLSASQSFTPMGQRINIIEKFQKWKWARFVTYLLLSPALLMVHSARSASSLLCSCTAFLGPVVQIPSREGCTNLEIPYELILHPRNIVNFSVIGRAWKLQEP